MITFVAAMSKGNIIGNKGKIPWGKAQRADIKHFRDVTLNNTIIVGSSTFAADGFPLPERKHIVITREPGADSKNVTFMNFAEALDLIQEQISQNFYVIGGEAIFKLFINYADVLDLTFIDADYEGDRFFPSIDKKRWKLISKDCHKADQSNLHDYCFVRYHKK